MTGRDAVIIGAGLAGSAAAIRLARAGKHVTLLDKATGAHDKICGEFLSRTAQHHLADLGVDLEDLGAASIDRIRLIRGGQSVSVDLGFTAKSLSRKVLDTALIGLVAQVGADVQMGCKANAFHCAQGLWQIDTNRGTHQAPALFLATGKQDMRATHRPSTPLSDVVAFKMHYLLHPQQTAELSSHVELILFEQGYAGLEMIEQGKANLCMVVSKSFFQKCGKQWSGLLRHILEQNPWLASRLLHATPLWEKPLAIAGVPYGFLHRDTKRAPENFYRLGDQMAVIPSFCGDGMALALHSASLASKHSLQSDSKKYHAECRRLFRPNVRRAALLSHIIGHPVGQAVLFQLSRAVPTLLRYADRRMRLGGIGVVLPQ